MAVRIAVGVVVEGFGHGSYGGDHYPRAILNAKEAFVRLIDHAPVRLILIVRLYGKNYYLHGAIPVAFHWVLALFVLVWARLTYGRWLHPARAHGGDVQAP